MVPVSELFTRFGKVTEDKVWAEMVEILGNIDSRVLDILRRL